VEKKTHNQHYWRSLPGVTGCGLKKPSKGAAPTSRGKKGRKHALVGGNTSRVGCKGEVAGKNLRKDANEASNGK